jgi:hypothetical protein
VKLPDRSSEVFQSVFRGGFRLDVSSTSAKLTGRPRILRGRFSVQCSASCRRDLRQAQGKEGSERRNLSCSHVRQDKGVGPGIDLSARSHWEMSRPIDCCRRPIAQLTARRATRTSRHTSARWRTSLSVTTKIDRREHFFLQVGPDRALATRPNGVTGSPIAHRLAISRAVREPRRELALMQSISGPSQAKPDPNLAGEGTRCIERKVSP